MLAGGDEVSGALKQVGADGGQAVLLGEGAVVESVEQAQPDPAALGHRHRDGSIEGHDRTRRSPWCR